MNPRPSAPGSVLAVAALALLCLALPYPVLAVDPGDFTWHPQAWWEASTHTGIALQAGTWLVLALGALRALWATPRMGATLLLVGLSLAGSAGLIALAPADESVVPGAAYWLSTLALSLLSVISIQRVAALPATRWSGHLTAALFGLWVLLLWEQLVMAFAVPRVLLPPPSSIAVALWTQTDTLWADLIQTVGKAVLIGYALGCGLGILTGIAIDKMPFLQRGLLPVASLTSTIPLVGVAPIAVMWFGFDWPSKAAVIVLMTFFPALISTLAGLQAAGKLERELMYSYAASYRRTLLDLRLPVALPFIFNALKVNASLALIGAIVAEFFGSPTVGLGFRISTEASRMNMPLVWATIVVASAVGMLGYAALSRLERRVNFWHPSVRSA
ncbi:ABC transporter permease [Aquabacterium sp.]|uniref:ABC transporter permease n=1 Tax=Aquabacterium sp. TaxID=1872578 RepID=UPI003B6FB8A1